MSDPILSARITQAVPAWAEQAIRLDERRRLATHLARAIDDGQYVALARALGRLDEDARRASGLLVHALTQVLDAPAQPEVEPEPHLVDRWFADIDRARAACQP